MLVKAQAKCDGIYRCILAPMTKPWPDPKFNAKLLLASRKTESEGQNLTEHLKKAGLQFSSKNAA